MKRALIVLILASMLMYAIGFSLVNFASANFVAYLPTITIKSDGSVEPETQYINHTGNTYTLTGDIYRKYAIQIFCSDIVFDGAGFTINGFFSTHVGYGNTGLNIENSTEIKIKDLKIIGFNRNIIVSNCSKCRFFNVTTYDILLRNCNSSEIEKCDISGILPELHLSHSNDNVVTDNYIEKLVLGFSENNYIQRNNVTSTIIADCSNYFFSNNFLAEPSYRHLYSNVTSDFWDNGSIGNYWSDYLTKYPNATEIGSTGIGDTPYVIDANNVDHYPLMVPFEELPQPTSSPTAEVQTQNGSFIVPALFGVFSAVGVVKAVSLLVYLRNRKR